MPELPEVETVRNELLPQVRGALIRDVWLSWPGIVPKTTPDAFRRGLTGRRVLDIERRGKYLIFALNAPEAWLVHLKMTGSLLVKPFDATLGKLVRAVVYLDNDIAVHFHDPRKFGRFWLTADAAAVTGKLGPEPLSDSYTLNTFSAGLAKRHTPIKPLLLDQGFIAGIGNMYADESLYATRIHPLRPADSLRPAEVKRLYAAIRSILWQAIENKGASMANYLRPSGEIGSAHFEFKVAHGANTTCPRCGSTITRIVVRQRGTYFCPRCQRNHAGGSNDHRRP
jgi:formamidopyrimidine-DNA glycosylase